MHILSILLIISFILSPAACNCNRPDELKVKEEHCWNSEIEIIERVVKTSKSVLNFARKKLGMEADETDEPIKCEYYQCIFKELKMINSNGFPVYDDIRNWIENHVTYQQTLQFIKQLDKCNDALTNSTVNQYSFFADEIGKEDRNVQITPQTTCDKLAEFMKCLSGQEGCPVFVYP